MKCAYSSEPSDSSTSTDPHFDDAARPPCFATRAPEAAVTMIEEGAGGVGYSFRLDGDWAAPRARSSANSVTTLRLSRQSRFGPI